MVNLLTQLINFIIVQDCNTLIVSIVILNLIKHEKNNIYNTNSIYSCGVWFL